MLFIIFFRPFIHIIYLNINKCKSSTTFKNFHLQAYKTALWNSFVSITVVMSSRLSLHQIKCLGIHLKGFCFCFLRILLFIFLYYFSGRTERKWVSTMGNRKKLKIVKKKKKKEQDKGKYIFLNTTERKMQIKNNFMEACLW